jgi:hypothetical protein
MGKVMAAHPDLPFFFTIALSVAQAVKFEKSALESAPHSVRLLGYF